MGAAAAIEARELVKEFGARRVVDRVDFTIDEGEIFGFLGPNGAGKTTTLRMLCGLLAPTSGSSRVAGFDLATETRRVKGHIGYMSQAFGLYRDLTVSENLFFYGSLYLDRAVATRRRDEVLERVGLAAYRDHLARELSGGWRQRLALGCSLLHRPEVLFLDEPTAGIDPVSRRELWDLLYELVREGLTLFVTTHYMEEAERCNRIGFIAGGKLLAIDRPARLKSDYLEGAILALRGPDLIALHGAIRQDFPEASFYGNEIHLVVGDAGEARGRIDAALARAGGLDCQVEQIPPSIEDVFVQMTRRAGG